jgi:hypothetical protein
MNTLRTDLKSEISFKGLMDDMTLKTPFTLRTIRQCYSDQDSTKYLREGELVVMDTCCSHFSEEGYLFIEPSIFRFLAENFEVEQVYSESRHNMFKKI